MLLIVSDVFQKIAEIQNYQKLSEPIKHDEKTYQKLAETIRFGLFFLFVLFLLIFSFFFIPLATATGTSEQLYL